MAPTPHNLRSLRRTIPLKPHTLILLGVFLLLAISNGLLANQSAGEKLKLVENKVSLAPIIVFKDAPPLTRKAADDLASFFEKVSGARPQIIEGEPTSLPEHGIWVGYQPKLKELFPETNFDFQHPEEILITANAKHLVIAGRDRWNPERLSFKGFGNKTYEGKQLEYGTANAIYTFVQQYLNVRWIWPGETGEDIIKQDTIAFAPFEYRYHPQFLARSGLFRWSAFGDARGQSQEWVRFQRLQLDSFETENGHGFNDWWERFHTTHPEYFALQPDGTRSGFPDARAAKQCVSNPAVWAQWGADVEEELKNNPDKTVFNGAPNDSYNRGHCVCEKCKAWDNANAQKYDYAWDGVSQEYVALSDRHATLYNKLAAQLRERFPNRDDLYVAGMSYGNWRPGPIAVTLDKNVIIYSVANLFFKNEDFLKEQREHVKGWGKTAKLIWRPNMWYQRGLLGLPEIDLKEAEDNFRLLAENHCIGVHFDSIWEHWSTQGPQYYLMAQLAWNPWLDGQAIMDDYYKRGFGPAADEIAEYWKRMQEASRQHTYLLEKDGKGILYNKLDTIGAVYTPEFMKGVEDLLQRADEIVAAAPAIYQKRVSFVRSGLTFTRLMYENLALMKRVESSKGQDTAALEQARAVWKQIEELNAAYPYSLKFNRVIAGLERQGSQKALLSTSPYFGYISKKYPQKKNAEMEAP